MAKRKDIHRPSALVVEDYEFIKFDYLPSGGDVLGDAMFLAEGRKRFVCHMEAHGASYAENKSNGNCFICGAWNIYSATFYHKPSNSYIKCGLECADNLECGDANVFKKEVKRALEAAAGKRKAKAILEEKGMAAAWALYESEAAYRKAFHAENKAWHEANPEPEMVSDASGYGMIAVGAPKYKESSRDELIVLDMVSKVVKYGNAPSDKALSFMATLLERIENAPAIAAAREAEKAAERAAGKAVPLVEGRVLVKGEVLSLKGSEGPYGYVMKMLVKCDGFKLYGTCPASLLDEKVAKGDVVEFNASIKRSDKDELFGFWSRPAKAKVVSRAKVEEAA